MRHYGPPEFPQAAKVQRRNELRRARRIAERLIEYTLWDYEGGKDWYAHVHKQLRDRFSSSEDREVFAGMLAATSPQADVRMNVALAWNAYKDWKAGRIKGHKTFLPCHKPNILRAIAREPLSGQKVEAFRKAILGDAHSIVVDTWMIRAAGFPAPPGQTARNSHIRITHEAIRLVSDQSGWTGAEVQASVWTAYRLKNWIAKKDPGNGAMVL